MNPKKEEKKAKRLRHEYVLKQINDFFQESDIEADFINIQKYGSRNKFAIRKRTYSVIPRMMWVGAHGRKKRINSNEYFKGMKYGITSLKWMGIQVDGRPIKSDDFFSFPSLDHKFIYERVVRLKSYKVLTDKIMSVHKEIADKADDLIDDYLQTDDGKKDIGKARDDLIEEATEYDFLTDITEDQIKFMFDHMEEIRKFLREVCDNRVYINKLGFEEFKELIVESRVHRVMKS